MAGSNLDFWRGFFKQDEIGFDLFEVINWGLTVAASDRPEELKSHRDEIMSKLFATSNKEFSEDFNNNAGFKKGGIDDPPTTTTTSTASLRRIPRPKTLIFPKQDEVTAISTKNLGTEHGKKVNLVVAKDDSTTLDAKEIELKIKGSKRQLRQGYQQAAKRQHLVKVLRMDELPNGGICCSWKLLSRISYIESKF